MNKENQLIFVKHILENIKNVEDFSRNLTKKELERNKQKQYAIVRAIEVVGEAAKNLSTSFKEKHSEISWKEIIGTRDRIIHHYFGVDLDIIWEIVKKDLPDLKKKIQEILDKEEQIR